MDFENDIKTSDKLYNVINKLEKVYEIKNSDELKEIINNYKDELDNKEIYNRTIDIK